MRVFGSTLFVLACATATTAAQKTTPPPIWPKQAVGLSTITLGDMIMRSLPLGSSLSWDALQTPSVRWITDGIDTTETGYSTRTGIARIRAAGVAPKMLRQGWVELAWSVSLESAGNAKFGPEKIVLQPGLADPDYICFGTRFQGCSFPVSSMKQPGLTLKKACERGPGSAHVIVFAASAAGGRNGTVIYRVDAGSGDSTNTVEVLPGGASSFCSRPEEN